MIERWGAFVARRALAVLLAGLAVAFAAGAYGFGVFDHLSQGGFDDKASESARELQAERDTFGNQSIDVVAIYTSEDLVASDPEFQADVEQIVAGLRAGHHDQRRSPTTTRPADAGLVSKDGHSAQVLISLAGESQDDYLSNYDELAPTLEADPDTGLRHRPRRSVRRLQRRQRDHQRGPRPRRVDLDADRAAAGAADLRQPGRRLDAGPRRPARHGRRAGAGPGDHHLHRGLGLLGQRDLAARHRPGHRLRAVRDQPVPRGARAAARRRPGRVVDGDPPDDDHRRPHRAVLRADRGRRDVEPADLPAGLPQEHGVRRHGRGARRDAGRAHRAARDAAAARPPGRRRPAAVAPARARSSSTTRTAAGPPWPAA